MERKDVQREERAAEAFRTATRESYRVAVDQAFEAQKGGMRLSRSFFQNWMEALEESAEVNRRTLESLQRIAVEQREIMLDLSRDSKDAYDGFVHSLGAYEAEVTGRKDKDPES